MSVAAKSGLEKLIRRQSAAHASACVMPIHGLLRFVFNATDVIATAITLMVVVIIVVIIVVIVDSAATFKPHAPIAT